MSDNEKYEIKLECHNCGYEWKEQIQKGHLISNKWNGCIEVEDFAKKYIRNFICPNCECEREVVKHVQ